MLYKFIWIEGPYQLRKYMTLYSRMRYIGALPEPLKVSLIKSKLSKEKEKKNKQNGELLWFVHVS